jgi:uncharacterized protein (TIRG00374 family)
MAEAAPPKAAESKLKAALKQLIGLAVAAVFMYFAFRSANLKVLWEHMQHLNMLFVAGVCVSGILSHLLRSVRWVILLEPVSGRRISLWNSFCAILYGYVVNIVLPRGGEIARLVSITRSEHLPFVGVLPTLFIDRILDVAMLVLLLGVTLLFLPSDFRASMPWLVPGGAALCAATVAGFVVLPFVGKILRLIISQSILKEKLPERLLAKVAELSEQFDAGTRSLTNPITFPAIGGLSVAIWAFYWLNFYLMFGAFGLLDRVSMGDSLIVFTIGSAGVLVPTPGSVGSFHFLVSQALTMVSHIDQNLALAVATTLHLFCFVLTNVVTAGACFIAQSLLLSRARSERA